MGYSAMIMKVVINDCLKVLMNNVQSAYEANELKHHALQIANADEKYIDFQKKVDQQQLNSLKVSILRNFINSIPTKYNYLIKFEDWDSAMAYLTETLRGEYDKNNRQS